MDNEFSGGTEGNHAVQVHLQLQIERGFRPDSENKDWSFTKGAVDAEPKGTYAQASRWLWFQRRHVSRD